jgi:hypothetical protein
VVPEHLPWAQTHSSPEEEALLMSRLEELAKTFFASSGVSEGTETEDVTQ